MSERTHTPGPWVIDREGNIETVDHCPICEIIDATDTCAEYEANAHLIASAPSLLDALLRAREALKAFEDISGTWELYQHSPEMKAINAAIAKAKGEAV